MSNLEPSNLIRNENTLRLEGKVNLQTVSILYEDFIREMGNGINRLDCRDVREADSSAISFLLACKNLAKLNNVNLDVTGMGDQLLNLARLYGVDTLLESG